MAVSIEELTKVAEEKSVDIAPLLAQGFSPDEIYVALQYYQPSRGLIGEFLSGAGAGAVGLAHGIGGALQALPVTEDLGKLITEKAEELLQSSYLRPPTKAGFLSRVTRTAGEFAPLLAATAVAPETLLGRMAIPAGFGLLGFGGAYASQPEEDKSLERALATGLIHGGLASVPIGRSVEKVLSRVAPKAVSALPRTSSALAEALAMPPVMTGMGAASVYGATGDVRQALEQVGEMFSQQGLAEAFIGGLLGALRPAKIEGKKKLEGEREVPSEEELEALIDKRLKALGALTTAKREARALPSSSTIHPADVGRGLRPEYEAEIGADIIPAIAPKVEKEEAAIPIKEEFVPGIKPEHEAEIGLELLPEAGREYKTPEFRVEVDYKDLIMPAVAREEVAPEVKKPVAEEKPVDILAEEEITLEDAIKDYVGEDKAPQIKKELKQIKNAFTGLIESIERGEKEGRYGTSTMLPTISKLVKDITTTTVHGVNERIETLVDTVYGSAFSTVLDKLGIETPTVEAFVRGKKDILTLEEEVPIQPSDMLTLQVSREFKTIWHELFGGDHRTATDVATKIDNVIDSYFRGLTGKDIQAQKGAPELLFEAYKLVYPKEDVKTPGELLIDPNVASKIGEVLEGLEKKILQEKKTLPKTSLSVEEALFLKLITQYKDSLGSIVGGDTSARIDFADKVSRIITRIYMRNIHPFSMLERIHAVESVNLLSPESDFVSSIRSQIKSMTAGLTSVKKRLQKKDSVIVQAIKSEIARGKQEGLTVKEALERARSQLSRAQSEATDKTAVQQVVLQKQQNVVDKVLNDIKEQFGSDTVNISDNVIKTVNKSLEKAKQDVIKEIDGIVKELRSFNKDLTPKKREKASRLDLFVEYDPDTDSYTPTKIGRALGNITPAILVKQNTAWLKNLGKDMLRYKKTRDVLDRLKKDEDIARLLENLEKNKGEKWTVDRLFMHVFEKLADRYNKVSDAFSRLYNLKLLNSLGIKLAKGMNRTSEFVPDSIFDMITTRLADSIVSRDPSLARGYKSKEDAVASLKKDIDKVLLAEMTRVTTLSKGYKGYDPIKAFMRGLGINVTYVPSLKSFIKDKKSVDGYVILSFDSFSRIDPALEKVLRETRKVKSRVLKIQKIVEAVLDIENTGGEHIRDIVESRYLEPSKDKVHIVVRESAFKNFLKNPEAENLKSQILTADVLLKELAEEPVYSFQYMLRQEVLGKGKAKTSLVDVIKDVFSKAFNDEKAGEKVAEAINEIVKGRAVVDESATSRQTIRYILGQIGLPVKLAAQSEQARKEVLVISRLLGRNFYFPSKKTKLPTTVENFLRDPREYYLFQVLHRLSLLGEEKAEETPTTFTIEERGRGKTKAKKEKVIRTSKDILHRTLYDEVVEDVASAFKRFDKGRVDLSTQKLFNRVAVLERVVRKILGEKVYVFAGLSEKDKPLVDAIIGPNAAGVAWRNLRMMATVFEGTKEDYKTLFHELFHIVVDVVTVKDPDYWNKVISTVIDSRAYEKAVKRKDYETVDRLLVEAEERLAEMFESYIADKAGIRETEKMSIIKRLFRFLESIYVSIRNTLAAKGLIHSGIIDGKVADREVIKFFESLWKGEYRDAEEAQKAYADMENIFRDIFGDQFVETGAKINEMLGAEHVRILPIEFFAEVADTFRRDFGVELNIVDPDSIYHEYMRKADDYIAREITETVGARYRLKREDVERAWEGFKGAFEVFGKKEESPLFGKKKTIFDTLHINFILPAFNKYLRPIYNLYKENVYKVNRLIHDEASLALNKIAHLKNSDPELYEILNRIVIEADKREVYPTNLKDFIPESIYNRLSEEQKAFVKEAIEDLSRLYNRQWFLQADKDLRHSARLTLERLNASMSRHNVPEEIRQQIMKLVETRLNEIITPYDTVASFGFNVYFHQTESGRIVRKFREEEMLKATRETLNKFVDEELANVLVGAGLDDTTVNSILTGVHNFREIYNTITDNALALADSFYIPRMRGGGDYELRIFDVTRELEEEGLSKLAVKENYYIDTRSDISSMRQYKQIKDTLKKVLEEDLKDQKVLTISTSEYITAKQKDPSLSMSQFITRKLMKGGEDYDVVVVVGRKLLKEAQRGVEDLSPTELTSLIERLAFTAEDPELQEKMMSELPQMVFRAYADKSYGMSRRLRRVRLGADRDYAVQGYETDIYRILVSDLSKRTGYLINGFFTDAIARYKNDKLKELFTDPAREEALNKYIKMLYAPHSAMASAVYKIRLFASLYFLGLRVASAVYNITSLGTTFIPEAAGILRSFTAPELRGGKPTLKEVSMLYKNATKAIGDLKRFVENGWVSKDLSEIKVPENASEADKVKLQVLRHLLDYNTLESSYVRMLREEVMTVLPEPIMKIADGMMSPFRYSEIYSRAVGAISLVSSALEYASRAEITSPRFISTVREVIDRTFGDYTRANRMLLADPSSRFGAVMTLPTTLRGFVFNYFSLLAEWLGKRELEKIGFSLATFMFFGGLSGIPMLDDILDAIEKYTDKSIRLRVKRALDKSLGENLSDLIIKGVPYMIGFSDWAPALRVETPFPLYPSARDLTEFMFGVYRGLYEKLERGVEKIDNDEYLAGIVAFLPYGLQLPVEAYKLSTEGLRTRYGTPVYSEEGKPIKLSPAEAVIRALGFRPVELAEIQDKRFLGRRLLSQLTRQRQKIYYKIRKDPQSRDILRMIEDYNKTALAYEGIAPLITGETIRRVMSPRRQKELELWQVL